MQDRFELLGGHVCSQDRDQVVGAARASLQGGMSLVVELVDGMAHRLFVAGEGLRDAGGAFPASRGQQNLAATQHKGIRGTQPGRERLAFLFGEVADKYSCFHGTQYTTSQITSLENALAYSLSQRG